MSSSTNYMCSMGLFCLLFCPWCLAQRKNWINICWKMKKWVDSICFLALNLQVPPPPPPRPPMPPPIWLQLDGWNFHLGRAHFEIRSWPDDLARRRKKDRILGRKPGKSPFPPRGNKEQIVFWLLFFLLFKKYFLCSIWTVTFQRIGH